MEYFSLGISDQTGIHSFPYLYALLILSNLSHISQNVNYRRIAIIAP